MLQATSEVSLLQSVALARMSKRYLIIDALRFVLAFWVLMAHKAIPFPLPGLLHFAVGRVLKGAWGSLIFGTPAVIGFFVISGFCIHLPFRDAEKLPLFRFYLRRYTRILLPVLAALVAFRLADGHLIFLGSSSILWGSVLWSVLCEEIYYAIYPALRVARTRFGWLPVIIVAFVLSETVVLTHRNAQDWFSLGPILTAIILAPVWLLGCYLAEQAETLPTLRSSRTIWCWRAAAWTGAWACGVLRFHGGIPAPQTSAWLGILLFLWIRKEIEYGKDHKPASLLIWGGAWSYSLYLIHPPLLTVFDRIHIPYPAPVATVLLGYLLILTSAYIFALAIEFPSHRLARKINMKHTKARPQLVPISAFHKPEGGRLGA